MFKKVIISVATLVALSSVSVAEFIDYSKLTKQLKADAKKNGEYATTEQVKEALKSTDWAVVDVRTEKEYAVARIDGSTRVGREAPEKQLEIVVLDDEGKKMIKDKVIIVCNTASRASLEMDTFKKMGFSKVMIYDIEGWIDQCNPVTTDYSNVLNKSGNNKKFGSFKAEFCAK